MKNINYQLNFLKFPMGRKQWWIAQFFLYCVIAFLIWLAFFSRAHMNCIINTKISFFSCIDLFIISLIGNLILQIPIYIINYKRLMDIGLPKFIPIFGPIFSLLNISYYLFKYSDFLFKIIDLFSIIYIVFIFVTCGFLRSRHTT